MTEIWTLKVGTGTAHTLSSLGITGLTRTLRSQDADEVTFSAKVKDATAAALASYGDWITIYRSGVIWFYGRVNEVPRALSGPSETIGYKLAGPWWYLENLPFAQRTIAWEGSETTGSDEVHWSTHCYMGIKTEWDETLNNNAGGWKQVTHSIRTQIEDVLHYVNGMDLVTEVEANPVIQIAASEYPVILDTNTGLPAAIPIDEVCDITCAEVIRKQLRWIPDAVTWFDYTTTVDGVPRPTFHCKRHADLDSISITITKPIDNIEISPRYELQKTGVNIKYEQTNTINGSQRTTVFEDAYPPAPTPPATTPPKAEVNQIGCLGFTITLAGYNATIVTATTEARAFNAKSATPATRLAWWTQHNPWLGDTNSVKNAVVADAVVTGENIDGSEETSPTLYANELVGGTICPWMTGIHQNTVVVKATITYEINTGTKKTETLSAKVVLTDAAVGSASYQTVSSFTGGDTLPTGIAKALYDALNRLQFSGNITTHEVECGNAFSSLAGRTLMGYKISVTGAGSQEGATWASMEALIQQVSEDVDRGTTSITFGPAEHLGPQDMIELLKVNRQRQQWSNPTMQVDSTVTPGSVGMPSRTPKHDLAKGDPQHDSFACERTGHDGMAQMFLGYDTGSTSSQPGMTLTASGTGATGAVEMWTADVGSPAAIALLSGSKVAKFREVPICIDGVQKKFVVLCSNYYA